MRRFNFDEFLCFIIFILLDIAIIYLTVTGKIDFYVGKKMILYIYITIVMISIMILFQFQNIFTFKRNSNIKMKLLPILLAIILGIISINHQETFKHNELKKDFKENTLNMKYLYEHELNLGANQKENSKKEILVINENNPMILDDIRINPDKYIGRKLEIHGFVCKENYLNTNQFIIGRVIMDCCAADSKVIGIVGEYEKACDLNENEKIIANGKMGIATIIDINKVNYKIPALIIENLQEEKDLDFHK